LVFLVGDDGVAPDLERAASSALAERRSVGFQQDRPAAGPDLLGKAAHHVAGDGAGGGPEMVAGAELVDQGVVGRLATRQGASIERR
jgi:hypothetical protein